MMEASPDDLEIAEGVVSVRGTPSKSVTISDVAKQAFHRAQRAARRDRGRARGDGAVPPEAVPHLVERHPHLRGGDRRRDLAARGEALHRVGGLRPHDQPDGGRGPDLRRRRAGHGRGAARGLRVRRRGQPAHHDVHGLPPAHDHRGARASRSVTSRPSRPPTPAATRAWAKAARSARTQRSPTRCSTRCGRSA